MPDANIIIWLHQAGLWGAITSAYDVVLPETVAQEIKYYEDEWGERQPIDVAAQASDGTLTILSADLQDMENLLEHFEGDLLEGLHAGEQEALALILSGRFSEGLFCSGDRLALVALVAIGYEGRCASLETVLRLAGRQLNQVLRARSPATEAYFRRAIEEGHWRQITREGIRRG